MSRSFAVGDICSDWETIRSVSELQHWFSQPFGARGTIDIILRHTGIRIEK
jgi:hypothetical protein